MQTETKRGGIKESVLKVAEIIILGKSIPLLG